MSIKKFFSLYTKGRKTYCILKQKQEYFRNFSMYIIFDNSFLHNYIKYSVFLLRNNTHIINLNQIIYYNSPNRFKIPRYSLTIFDRIWHSSWWQETQKINRLCFICKRLTEKHLSFPIYSKWKQQKFGITPMMENLRKICITTKTQKTDRRATQRAFNNLFLCAIYNY